MNLPNDSNRHIIVGMTGSGKTQAGIHALSLRSFPLKPWFLFNFKDDDLINSIPGAEHIDVADFPKSDKIKGIFVVHSAPGDYDSSDAFLMKIWERQNAGVYIDEMYMVAKQGWFSTPLRYLLTQGRSRHTPVIALSQRPSWIDAFTFTEASFIQTFKLTTIGDQKRVTDFIRVPEGGRLEFNRLPKYSSYYYDAEAPEDDPHKLVIMGPADQRQDILDRFDRRRPEPEHRGLFTSISTFFTGKRKN